MSGCRERPRPSVEIWYISAVAGWGEFRLYLAESVFPHVRAVPYGRWLDRWTHADAGAGLGGCGRGQVPRRTPAVSGFGVSGACRRTRRRRRLSSKRVLQRRSSSWALTSGRGVRVWQQEAEREVLPCALCRVAELVSKSAIAASSNDGGGERKARPVPRDGGVPEMGRAGKRACEP